METYTSKQPNLFRRLLIFSLIAVLLIVAAVAVAESKQSASDPILTLQTVAEESDRQELSSREIAQKNLPSIVSISTEATVTVPGSGYSNPFGYGFGFGYGSQQPYQYRSVGAGSGIVISEDGYVLTNAHVVDGATSVTVTLNDDTPYEAVVVGSDAANDVAVLKINAKGLTPAVFGDSDQLVIGDAAMVIGNPLGEVNGSASMGIISALPRQITIDSNEMTLLQTDAAINPGNSGGALINSYGEVVGIVTAKTAAVQVEGIGYAIPINIVKDRIEELVNQPIEQPSAPGQSDSDMRLGISIREVTAELSEQTGLPVGVYVLDVEAFSAAEKAGIRSGDVIIRLAGQDATTHAQLEEIKTTLQPGDEQEIVVVRDGEEKTLTIKLGTAPSA